MFNPLAKRRSVSTTVPTSSSARPTQNRPLALGVNPIVVRAVDQAGNPTTATIDVTREAPENHLPSVDAGADQSITLPNSALLDGKSTGDGFPERKTLTTT
jgi:hypothetical protein